MKTERKTGDPPEWIEVKCGGLRRCAWKAGDDLRPDGYNVECRYDRIPNTGDDETDGKALVKYYIAKLRDEADKLETELKGTTND